MTQLLEEAEKAQTELKAIQEVRARLDIQAISLRLICAEALRDYHDQMRMILQKPDMPLTAMGPELLSINRESLSLQLDISKIRPPTEDETRAMEERVSQRMSGKLSNLLSPESRHAPQTAKTGSQKPSRNLALETNTTDEAKSTKMSTQRP